MKLLSNPNKYISVLLLFFISFLPQSRLQAADCPTLTKKTLNLCNPTREEVAEGLGTPIAIIDGVRAVGHSDPSNDEFFSSIKGQEYTFKWIFKDGAGNVVATGCPQTFELQDNEAPTCGAATLVVHGYGSYVGPDVFKSEFRNQPPTWVDNCTPTSSITVNFNESEISGNYWNNQSVEVSYTLTDSYENIKTCNQTLISKPQESHNCPAIKQVTIEIPQNACDISSDHLITTVQNNFPTELRPMMDGYLTQISPTIKNNKVTVFSNNTGSTVFPNKYGPGEYNVYFNYKNNYIIIRDVNTYCPVSVIVRENSTPPSCPELSDIIIDKTSVTADEIETSIKGLINQYSTQLDNCSPNTNLDVIYSGESLSAPYCGTISYALSDYGSMRSCTAKVILPQCPNLPALTKKYCDYNYQPMPKQQLVDFLNSNKPSLTYCANKVEGVYDASKLSNSYSNGSHPSIEWKFSFNGITKNCSQTINIQRDNNLSCVGKDITLEAQKNCIANGTNIPLPTVSACGGYSLQWKKTTEVDHIRHEVSDLRNSTFSDGDVITWTLNYNNATCTTHISVVDNTKPTCTNPSLGKLTGKCSFTRSEVEAKMPTTDKLGTDNCGIKSAAIDWDQTAFETFTSNSDGSPKTYDIYYTITDNSELTNDGFCIATIEVEGIPAPNCPDTEVYALSLDGTVQLSLSNDAEWSLKSPSSITFNAGKLTGLSFGKDNNIELEARWCNAFKKVCPTTVKLIKAVSPCKD